MEEDYQRVAKAIAFIREHHLSQPDLITVAGHIGLSEYHFQRLFTRWVGISPKRFLQYVTLEYAKSQISQIDNLLDLTEETAAREILLQSWSNAEIISDRSQTQPLCDRIFNFATVENKKPLTLLVKGTNFQIQVWRALLEIPFGKVTTYQTIARAIARPTATRAVGNAVGKNPIGYLIPCHRVIRVSGELGGYRWGTERKGAILAWEAGIQARENQHKAIWQ